MSSDSDGHDEPPEYGPDKVGYGKPPKETRFKLGQVANPYGRPKGSKNRPHAASNDDLRKIVVDEAYRDVTINDPNGPVTVPMAKAIIRSTNVSAVKGNTRAQRNSTELILKTEAEIKRERDHEVEVAINFKIAWQREFVRRKQAGIRGPAVLPHPDHVVVDLATGRVNIKGPATKEEKVAWARWEGYRDVFMAELRELQAERDEPSCPDPEELEAEIAGIKAVLEIVGYALDGQRDAMSMLEGVFTKLKRTDRHDQASLLPTPTRPFRINTPHFIPGPHKRSILQTGLLVLR